MKSKDEILFLKGKVSSLKRALLTCNEVRTRCKNKSTALALQLSRLKQIETNTKQKEA